MASKTIFFDRSLEIVKNERFSMYVQQMQQVQMDIEKVCSKEVRVLHESGQAYS